MKPLRIALTGDSMTDCWGNCAELQSELATRFPRREIVLDNHAIGGTRAGYGLYRLNNDYDKNGARKTALSNTDPDIVILETFAYNNLMDGAAWLDDYLDLMKRFIAEIQRTTRAKVLFHVTIPPDRARFVENVLAFHETSLARRQELADGAVLYLEAARELAQRENWPLADVYGEVQKRVENGEPLARFINQADQIHPSRYAYAITAQVISAALQKYDMIGD